MIGFVRVVVEPCQRATSAVRAFWLDHIWSDFVLAVLLILTHAIVIHFWSPADLLGNAAPADRRSVYSAAALVVSLLGSFSAVAISQLSNAKGDRAAALKQQAGDQLARNWRSIYRWSMLAALLALVALLIDPSTHTEAVAPVIARVAFEFGMVISIVKFVRLSALFFEILNVATLDDKSPAAGKAPAPGVNPKLLERAREQTSGMPTA